MSGVSGNQYDLHPMSLGIDPKLLHKFLPLRNSFMRKNGQTDRQTQTNRQTYDPPLGSEMKTSRWGGGAGGAFIMLRGIKNSLPLADQIYSQA